ncbi:Membrane domain of glycerophosphoryl diester phosphodiesterase [Chlamydia trachomatis]|nr:Membrane domain of glycerophosphoryl diester phosphodiesterase [Chlamydia trachomatis]CRH91599.1 Membrane domain of glycerophosphoryl diester phosphodiesterase [Chlamydia trachomatis]
MTDSNDFHRPQVGSWGEPDSPNTPQFQPQDNATVFASQDPVSTQGFTQPPNQAMNSTPVSPGSPSPVQPGIVPLRPLGVGDLFSGTFEALSKNPFVLFVLPGIVTIVAGIITLVTIYFAIPDFTSLVDLDAPISTDDLSTIGMTMALRTIPFVLVLLGLAGLFPAIVVPNGTADAIIGKKLSAEDAFNRFKSRLLAMIGLSIVWVFLFALIASVTFGIFLLVGLGVADYVTYRSQTQTMLVFLLFGSVGAITTFLVCVFFQVRFAFAQTVCAVENLSPRKALKRSWTLTQGVAFKTLGRSILIAMVMGAVGGVFSGVLSTFTAFTISTDPQMYLTAIPLAAVASTIVQMLVMPLSQVYIALMYVDERIRKENYAYTLMEQIHH